MAIAIVFAIPLGYLAAKRHRLDVRQRHDRDVADRRGRARLLPRVPAQVLVRRPDPPSRCRAGRTPHWAAPGSPASSWLDGLLTREFDCSADALRHLVLPSIVLATIPFAVIFRITRASVLEVLDEDYVRTAESKGLTIQVIRARHVMRNALLPVITTIGLQTGGLLAGAVLTETVFNFGGIGSTLQQAFNAVTTPCCRC